jgi:hypothetical protein
MGEARKDGAKIESRRKTFTYIGQLILIGKRTDGPSPGYAYVQHIAFQICIYKQFYQHHSILSLLICVSTFTFPQHHQLLNQYHPLVQPK